MLPGLGLFSAVTIVLNALALNLINFRDFYPINNNTFYLILLFFFFFLIFITLLLI